MEQMILLSLFSGPFFTIKNGLIVALIVGFLCLFLLIAIVWIYLAKRISEDDIIDLIKESIDQRNGRIRKAIKNVVIDDEDISNYLYRQSCPDYTMFKSEIETMVRKEIDKIQYNQTVRQEGVYETHLQSPILSKQVENSVRPTPQFLYASTVDEDNRVFYEVTNSPKSDTVFILNPNFGGENEALFTVYDKAFRMVIQEQGHLKGGCVIENPEMNYTSTVKTIEFGLACLKDGRWKIKEKAKVKFE